MELFASLLNVLVGDALQELVRKLVYSDLGFDPLAYLEEVSHLYVAELSVSLVAEEELEGSRKLRVDKGAGRHEAVVVDQCPDYRNEILVKGI